MTSCPIKTKIFYITVIYIHFTCTASVARNTETLFDKNITYTIQDVIIDCCLLNKSNQNFQRIYDCKYVMSFLVTVD